MQPVLPYLPTGAAFREHGWQPTPAEIVEFLETAELLGLPGANFWEWAASKRIGLWSTVAEYEWTGVPPPPPGPRMVAVNTGLLNIRNAPVVTPSTLIGQTPLDKEWTVTGEVQDGLGRTWLQSGPTAHLAGWLCRECRYLQNFHPCRSQVAWLSIRACAKHAAEAQKKIDEQRGSSAKRGYGGRWQRLRKMYLNSNPVCVDPDRRHPNRVIEATEVDHIIAKSSGGSDEWSNLQALCKSCHSYKTATEDGAWG
jgi:5-methylcytosine-specific restriction protein A